MQSEFEIKEKKFVNELSEIQQLALKYKTILRPDEKQLLEKEKGGIFGFFSTVSSISIK
jgi:hypothetical protein